MPHPSARTKPSARESKVLQRPSEASIPAPVQLIDMNGAHIACTPPHKAPLTWFDKTFVAPRTVATRAEEQAVSIDAVTPVHPNTYATLPAAVLAALLAPPSKMTSSP